MDEAIKKQADKLFREVTMLPDNVLDHFRESLERHSYAVRLDAHHAVRSILAPRGGGSCSKTDLVVVSGRDRTDDTGKAVLPIHDLLCGASHGLDSGGYLVLVRQPQIVATPISSLPVFLTTVTRTTPAPAVPNELLSDRDGNTVAQHFATVEVDVLTWQPDGTAAPNTFFSWMCTVEAGRLVVIGG